MQVLIVDDNFLVAISTMATLQDAGQDAVVVGTISAALAHLAQSKCDAAVLDFDLDGHSSEPVAIALTQRRIPYVLTTATSAVR